MIEGLHLALKINILIFERLHEPPIEASWKWQNWIKIMGQIYMFKIVHESCIIFF